MCDRCYHGRLLPLPLSNYLPKIKTMAYLKIKLPVYKKTQWETLKKDGTLEASAEVESLSEGYEMLKKQ
jgi:hypothetical protein